MQGPLSMLLSALFFAVMGAFIKALGRDIPLFEITFFRAGVSALILGGVMLVRGIPLRGKNQRLLLIRALAGFAAMTLNFYALAQIPLGDAALLNQSSPIFVVLLSWYFLDERIPSLLMLLVLLSFVGILLVLRPSGNLFNAAGLAGLGGAVFAAGAYVAIRQLHQTDSFWTMAFYFMVVAALLSLPPMLHTWVMPNPGQTLLLIGSGLFGSLGQLFMTYAYKNDSASWVAPFSYAGVLFSFLFGIWFFGDSLDWVGGMGAGLTVLGGIALLFFKSRREEMTR
ncbi:MAG TPA: DMT family transporter [bacterium]|nr:DMT family transporter [bacterium]